ncbi:MAG: PorT family protein [Chitinophaga sp.]|uniref:outer membrane beta-barrel protein n=1 Tax=Chitinophaga sp. TaxID=1869181 RepID=UPI001B08F4AE|nr:outer membrane beta-barrel protein [Chitinophaga sp.]MBO9727218.1 PorT family protein [Chitinophaga sp.]
MKFFTLLCAALLLFVVSNSHAQVSLGIRGGYVNAGLAVPEHSTAPGTSHQDRWQVGTYLNIPLFKGGYLQPGASYIVKGANLNYISPHPDLFTSGATKLTLRYLELPVNFVYKVPVGFGKLLVGAGPYAAYCVRGDYKLEAIDAGGQVSSGSKRIDFKSSPNIFGTGMNIQRWDAGLNFTAGVELNCFLTLTGHYGYGLMNLDKSTNNLNNRYWGVSLGFIFDREDW